MIEVQKLENLIASLIQFGPSPDGAVERDIEAAIARLRAENERLTAERGYWKSVHYEGITAGKDLAKLHNDALAAAEARALAAEAREAKAVEALHRAHEAMKAYAQSLRGQHATRNEIADELDRLAAIPTEVQNG
ncbi:MAG: hypothetical protein ACTHJQ_03340 [Rhizobiaceae bacterium]